MIDDVEVEGNTADSPNLPYVIEHLQQSEAYEQYSHVGKADEKLFSSRPPTASVPLSKATVCQCCCLQCFRLMRNSAARCQTGDLRVAFTTCGCLSALDVGLCSSLLLLSNHIKDVEN